MNHLFDDYEPSAILQDLHFPMELVASVESLRNCGARPEQAKRLSETLRSDADFEKLVAEQLASDFDYWRHEHAWRVIDGFLQEKILLDNDRALNERS